MKLVLEVHIINTEWDGTHAMMEKAVETPLIPIPGAYYSDTAWRDERVCKAITLCLEEGCYLLFMGDEECKGEDLCKEAEAKYRSHGWSSPGEADRSS